VTVVYADGAFTVKVHPRWGTDSVRIVLRGELDMLTAPVLDAALQAAELAAPRTIVVDLRHLFIDCRGLRVLLDAHERAGKAGRALAAVHPAGGVRRVLELTGTAETLCDGSMAQTPSR
jgi:anti-sigma B factor antagonist